MKKVMLLMMVAALATAANAVLFSEDFTSPVVFDPSNNPFNVWDNNTGGGTTMQWNEANANINASQQLVNTTGTTGQNRGVAYVLDPSEIGGIAAGNYTLQFDIIAMWNNAVMGVNVYNGTRDDTGVVNTYAIDLLSAAASPLVHVNIGSGSIDLLAGATYDAATYAGTTVQLDFAYDGTGDIVMVWDHPSSTLQKAYTIDNVEIIPEPATMALLGLGGLIGLRRRK